jgi:hypothetical protein
MVFSTRIRKSSLTVNPYTNAKGMLGFSLEPKSSLVATQTNPYDEISKLEYQRRSQACYI